MIGFYRIADRIIRIESLFEDVHAYCREYAIEKQNPDFEISISPEDLAYERKKSEAEAESFSGRNGRDAGDPGGLP